MSLKKLIGTRIYELRTRAELTQEQLAEMAGISNETVSRVERGIRSPSFGVLSRLAGVFGVEAWEFFNFSNRKFIENRYQLELVDLLNYLNDREPEDIKLVYKIARLILDGNEYPPPSGGKPR